uniref:Uncharacterized protein n=1 Tax=Chromera velia CCMP2878 TaxID=1169474 RepID=A0A0G4FCB0_9ALVE|eukprot:Cvel_16156.t1-p1 / transcript=Cvel_16156.t1 / gene=Cvel_16156 / organism=Chromera_velia_CCMP2878 / gene_product=hypothetical protein / transcript_product=hypothetical protein / location=Cvel_scaffold1231:264-503(-) / protein_length=80 / sequence_SO=supercontig / SO=protein_coding / is_pseudo=false
MLALGYPGLRYRVFHDQRPSDTSISAAVMNAADVDSLIRGLYSVSPERQKDVIERLYDEVRWGQRKGGVKNNGTEITKAG